MKSTKRICASLLVLCLLFSMAPVYANEAAPGIEPVRGVNKRIVIDDNAEGGYEGDYVVIYNPATSSGTSYSTGTMTGLIETTVNSNSNVNTQARTPDPEKPFYKLDVDPKLAEIAKTAETQEPSEPVRASYNVGDTKTFSIYASYSPTGGSSVQFKCLYVGQHCYIWTPSSSANNTYPLDVIDASFAELAANEFDSKFDLMQSSFGNHTNGSNGDGKLHMLYYNINDGWEPGQGYIAGFFYQVDITNNGLPILNIDTYPGVYYVNSAGTEYKRMDDTYNTMVHEYQHLINYSNTSGMGSWLNECFSAAAEEICYPGSSVVSRIQSWEGYYYSDNDDWLDPPEEFQYQSSNSLHTGYSMYAWSNSLDNTSLLTLYSQVSFFAQYLYTRFGNTIYRQISNNYSSSETTAITQATGVNVADLVRDFRIAVTANASQDQFDGVYGFKVQNGYDPEEYNGVQSPWDLLSPVVFTGSSCSIKGGGAITVKPVNGVYNPPSGASSNLRYYGIKVLAPYNVTAVSNNEEWGTVTVDGVKIYATPDPACYVESCEVLEGTASFTINGNVIKVDPDTDCTIQVNFAPKPSFTVSYIASGAAEGSVTALLGDVINLPESVSVSALGWTFSGWTAQVIAEETTEKPFFYAPGAPCTVTDNLFFYALYTRVEEGTGEILYQLADGPEDGGRYIIAAADSISGSTGYAVGNAIVTNNHYLSAPAITVNSDNTVTASASNLPNVLWEAASAENGFTFFNEAVGKYMGLDAAEYLYPSDTPLAWAYTANGYLDNQTDSEGYYYLSYASANGRYTTSKNGAVINFYKETNDDTVFYYSNPVPAEHDHVLDIWFPASAPTCGADGNIEYYRCSVCGKYFSDVNAEHEISLAETVIPATGEHVFGAWSSNNDGTHRHLCEVCGLVEDEDCTYSDEVVAPTPADQGYTVHTCGVCGYSFQDSFVPTLGYDYTVHFSVPAGVEQPADQVSNTNTGITLPTVAAPEGYEFLGWVIDSYDDVVVRPEPILTGSYIAQAEITLRALFSRFEQDGEAETGYFLVTDAASLAAGDQIIITANGSSSKSLSTTQNSNNRGSVEGVKSADYAVFEPAASTAILTLGAGASSGTFSLYDPANNGYLYTTSSGNNLRTQANVNNAASWTVSISASNNDATLTAQASTWSRRYLRYNSSSDIFSCYSSGQQNVFLYRYEEHVSGTYYYTTEIIPNDPVDVYFVDQDGNAAAYAYAFGDGAQNAAFPGELLTALGQDENGDSYYKITLNRNRYTNVIFSGGDSATQTADLGLGDGAHIIYYVNGHTGYVGSDIWPAPPIQVEPSCTEPGAITYIGLLTGESHMTVIPPLGHLEADAVEENLAEPSCTEPGGFDTVVYCQRCGAELSRAHTDLDALGHEPAEAVEENRVEPTDTTNGGYDSVVYCQRCGAELSRAHIILPALVAPAPVMNPDIAIYRSLSLGIEITANISVRLAQLEGVGRWYIQVDKLAEDGSVLETVRFGEGQEGVIRSRDVMASAVFTGITAKEMGVSFRISVHCFDGNENETYNESDVITFRDYLIEEMIKDNTDANRTLCADILNYAAAAQVFFGYDTEHLVNENLSAEAAAVKELYETKDAPAAELDNVASANMTCSLSVMNRIVVSVLGRRLNAGEGVVTFEVRDSEGGLKAVLDTVKRGSAYTADFNSLEALDMREPFTFTALVDGEPVGEPATWSVEGYVKEGRSVDLSALDPETQLTKQKELALLNALLIYVDSAAGILRQP